MLVAIAGVVGCERDDGTVRDDERERERIPPRPITVELGYRADNLTNYRIITTPEQNSPRYAAIKIVFEARFGPVGRAHERAVYAASLTKHASDQLLVSVDRDRYQVEDAVAARVPGRPFEATDSPFATVVIGASRVGVRYQPSHVLYEHLNDIFDLTFPELPSGGFTSDPFAISRPQAWGDRRYLLASTLRFVGWTTCPSNRARCAELAYRAHSEGRTDYQLELTGTYFFDQTLHRVDGARFHHSVTIDGTTHKFHSTLDVVE